MAITRFKNSSIANNTPKYDQMLAGLPYIPIIGTATDGGTGSTVSVGFTGNNVANGTITYTALSTPGSLTATGTSSPITVTGLTAGTAYTFQVSAANSQGSSAYSAASNSVTPVVPTSFESIATLTPTSGTSVTFSSIPQTYKHLQLRVTAHTASDGISLGLQFNGSTTSNYTGHILYGNGTTTATIANVNDPQLTINAIGMSTANISGVGIIDIIDYASTSKNKTMNSFAGVNTNTGFTRISLISGFWPSTAAINSITILSLGGYAYQSGTSFALYGIKG